ncbi:MAG: UDP-3-O-(3-hydroxymyristoyl)glucosamine N-acyltransferase [Candidatus Omnitrophica bacterium]|nr:UDP-3-O-(3-hydroxymyristoyl)glucosamine N-acyltransferase [Candidatus Omnitrophota bacterium]
MSMKLKEIAALIGGELVGSGDVVIKGINGINEAREGDIAFIVSLKYEGSVESTKASAVLVPKDFKRPSAKPLIRINNPSAVFSKLVGLLFPERIPHPKGVHKSAAISDKAGVGKNCGIGAYVVMEDGTEIGDNTVIYGLSYIGKNTKIGRDCIIYPNVTIREEISIGDRVIIHSGSVIGSDGFGYDTQKDGTHIKIPQVGRIVIEDDVELGACVTIDRARFSKTVIGNGSKIDNLCQIAHNVKLGPNAMIAAQCGISGSCEIGRNVVMGGQVGVADHLKLGDFVVAGAKSGITKSFPSKTTLFWYPAKPVEKVRDIIASVGLLPKLFKRVNELESRIKKIENK